MISYVRFVSFLQLHGLCAGIPDSAIVVFMLERYSNAQKEEEEVYGRDGVSEWLG